ncbi:GNAT family protein [Sphingobacterium sp. UT-1RO-CII-1]|uniref:GNAT family N-acetyltransferase n=1 Tax=Sphingobacterium sp. UT-1RO-CII-1 TaxID=2995225 RepID=UPI00227A297F|nr:GNAT family protein [Sphingobacterium sp. UT-1RO-CII-1]MCY4781360.1 GNAT family protein [Sphingobacterium sp. UT-1RO-CII-1]
MSNIISLKLLPFTRSDYSLFISWITDSRFLAQFAGNRLTYPVNRLQLDHFYSDTNRFPYKLIEIHTKATIGHAELLITPETIRIGQVIIGNNKLRNKGIGKKFISMLLHKAFANWDKEIVDLNVYEWNTVAIECYKKVGFKIIPQKTKKTQIGNEIWTTLNMRITRDGFNQLMS